MNSTFRSRFLSTRRWLLPALLLSGLSARAQAPAWQLALTTSTLNNTYSHVAATATDASGNVYLAGYFGGTARFGSTSLVSEGASDLFVAKWSPATNSFQWAIGGGSRDSDQATGLAVQGSDVYVTGVFTGPQAVFNTTRNIQLTNAGTGPDIFVAKLTQAGGNATFSWVQQAGGAGPDSPAAIVAQGTSVYVAGSFGSATASFGSISLTNPGGSPQDIFVAKLVDLGTTGSFRWARRAGGASYEFATSLAVSGSSVYVAGTFIGPNVDFGSFTLNANGFTNDVFVAKLTDAGSSADFT
jgi:hypothetical protein